MKEIDALALEIARCSNIETAMRNASDPCHQVVLQQKRVEEDFRHVPEAWAGDLGNARLLFISSNPSISTPEVPTVGEDYPLGGYDAADVEHPRWKSERMIDFQTRRLEQERANPYVNAKAQYLCRDDLYRGGDKATATKKSQSFWKNAFQQASDLVGPSFDLSHDICMTEIVHCKSKSEKGAVSAAPHCAEKYFHKILDLSSARLVIIVGRIARDIVMNNRENWNEGKQSKWEIDSNFGRLNQDVIRHSDHVGIINTPNRQHLVIAVQQLSWATNKYRMIESVIGLDSRKRLEDYIRSQEQMIFDSRDDLLRFMFPK